MSLSKARANKAERTPTTKNIALSRSPATLTRAKGQTWNENIWTVTGPK